MADITQIKVGSTTYNIPNSDYSGIAYCSTAAATAAKVATMPKFALASGQYILLRTTVTNSATSSVTLNVNSTGAKPIKIGNSSTAPTTSNFPAGDYLANYDGTNWILTRIYLTDTTYTFNGAVSTIKDSNLTASRALVSDKNGKVAVSAVTSTELGYLDGVTSAIQTQLNGKASSTHALSKGTDTTNSATLSFGGTFTAVTDTTVSGHTITDKTTTYTMPSDRLFTTLVPAGTAITTTGTDLKSTTYLKVGKYYCALTDTAKTLKNCPTSQAFMMEVYSPLSTTIDNETTTPYVYRLRKITEYRSGTQYIQYVGSGATAGSFTYDDWRIVPRARFTLDSTDTNSGSAATGSATKPVYLSADGTITACTYTLEKSVPSGAKFTDTTYDVVSTTANGLAPKRDGSTTKFLRADGTWAVPPDNDTTYSAGAGISLSGTTFSNSGVRSVGTGSENGTISVNTNGTATNVAVKGLGSAAYTASTAYAGATHNQASSTINAMTGYSKPSLTSAIAATDTLNAAIGKLEKAIDGKTSNTGTITGVTAGNGLTNGGTSGTVTLHVGAGTGITVNANDIAVKYGAEAGTACQGNDSRLSNARTPTSHAHGNITDGGTITSTAVTSATGVLVYDSSNKIQRATAANARSIIGAGTSNLALGETSSTAYRGDRGKIAYDHSQSAHAPSGAQANVIESVKVNGTALTVSSKAVNVTVPTKVSDLTNDSNFTSNSGTITKVQANGTDVASSGTANIPAASTSKYGVTKLSSSTSSTSTALAATASAVKAAYDKAVEAYNLASSGSFTYGTEDLVAGASALTTGTLYFVYE